jgi:PiT family inorganic phosphate transporter
MSDSTALERIGTRTGAPLLSGLLFGVVLVGGIGWAGQQLLSDVGSAGPVSSALPYIILGIALLIALGFEFVNGFHDTANAVATVIYTHSLKPNIAVVWSGLCNFLGVLTSSGAVAFGIVSLLPVELILQVGSDAGFSMVFALLLAAIVWNLGTWYLGLPSSSSHTLIGSVIGVGLMNQMMAASGSATSGVDWSQASKIGYSLLLSPLIGFAASAVLLLVARMLVKNEKLYKAPEGNQPPPWWIRGLLILTCSGVSFAHGSNDGQKGMGLIMLILIGTVPTAYALNRAVEPSYVQTFQVASANALSALAAQPGAGQAAPADAKAAVGLYVQNRSLAPETVPAVIALGKEIESEISGFASLASLPPDAMPNIRNNIYLESEALKHLLKSDARFSAAEIKAISDYRGSLDHATKFIPGWVKVAVAIALGLGTMIGWKRIVVTVGEKIGKDHLTYAQGASAELVAMTTIGLADGFGLPVSTTHVLSSGVAGTMAANKSGLQMATVRNLLMAWVLTLPASIALAGGLFWLLRHIF